MINLITTMDIIWITKAKQCHQELGFNEADEVRCEEIGDGNLNDVAQLYTHDDEGNLVRSVIVKHSLPYIKCLGPGFPCSEARTAVEYQALVKFHTLSPGSVPTPYLYDQGIHSMFMEDLRGYKVMRTELMEGAVKMPWMSNVAIHLADIHKQTHLAVIGQEALTTLAKQFENTDMVTLTKQYVFTFPFLREGTNNRCSQEIAEHLDRIYADEQVTSTANRMLKLFLEKKECLLHGDLHTGSIMVDAEHARMFDVEFAFVGPASFDVGMLLANIIFEYYRHMSIETNNDEHRQFAYLMIDAGKELVSVYLEHMTAFTGLDRATYIENLVSEVAGFAGCEIIRRLVGAAHVADLEGMPAAQVDCLGAGVRLLQAAHRIHTVDRLLVIALMLAY
ncbi:methylthioribose kinase-like isoform X1 [Dreissena polymorpha]|nr:methylthioribose kinase-like isoform X1 [Dreissena polymorpha]